MAREKKKIEEAPVQEPQPVEEPAPVAAPPARRNALGDARKALGKVFKDGKKDFVEVDESTFKEPMQHIPTGSIVINNLIGGRVNKWGVMPCPGFPRGRIINIYGRESCGKTTLCLETSALVCAAGGTVCYLDWENAIDVSYAKSLGVPVDDGDAFGLCQPVTFERGLAIIWTMARAGVDLIIVDSVGSGIPQAEQERSIAEQGGQGQVGYAARKWSDFLPKLRGTIAETNTCVIGISQLRSTISKGGPGGGPTELPQGGKAWKYYADVAIDLRRIGSEKGRVYDPLKHTMEEALTANIVQAEIKKCRVSASQGRSATFTIVYGEGIDDLRSVIEIGAANGVIKKGGAWYNWERPGGLIKGQGLKAFKEAVLKGPGLQEELYQLVVRALGNQPDNLPVIAPSAEDTLVGDLSFITGPVPVDDGVDDPEAD